VWAKDLQERPRHTFAKVLHAPPFMMHPRAAYTRPSAYSLHSGDPNPQPLPPPAWGVPKCFSVITKLGTEGMGESNPSDSAPTPVNLLCLDLTGMEVFQHAAHANWLWQERTKHNPSGQAPSTAPRPPACCTHGWLPKAAYCQSRSLFHPA